MWFMSAGLGEPGLFWITSVSCQLASCYGMYKYWRVLRVSISTHFLPRRCVSLDASGRLQQERLRFAMLPPSGSFEKAETRQQRWPTEQEHASSLSLSLSHTSSLVCSASHRSST